MPGKHIKVSCPRCGDRMALVGHLCRPCSYRARTERTRERESRLPQPNPSGLCMCGCGEPTPIAKRTEPRTGAVKGFPTRYLPAHHLRNSPVPYIVDPETGCWEWQWTKNSLGYGMITIDGKVQKTHRVYYERHRGPIPRGHDLHHECENKGCVNPWHGEPLPRKQHAGITQRWKRRLDPDDEAEIRRRGRGKGMAKELADEFGVSQNTIYCVWRGTYPGQ